MYCTDDYRWRSGWIPREVWATHKWVYGGDGPEPVVGDQIFYPEEWCPELFNDEDWWAPCGDAMEPVDL